MGGIDRHVSKALAGGRPSARSLSTRAMGVTTGSDDEETFPGKPGPRYPISDQVFRGIQTRLGITARGRRLPDPVSGQAQQGRRQDTQSGENAHPGPQDVRPDQEQQGRGQNRVPLPLDLHDILETWASPGPSPRVAQTQDSLGHRPGHGHGSDQEQQGRRQDGRPLPFDPRDIPETGTWVPQTPRPRLSRGQHATGHLPNHGQSVNRGHGPRPFHS